MLSWILLISSKEGDEIEEELKNILTNEPENDKIGWLVHSIRVLALAVCDHRKQLKWITKLLLVILSAIIISILTIVLK